MALVLYNPNPTCLAPQNHGRIHSVDRLNSQPTGFCTVMTTLHTSSIPPGACISSAMPGRTGTIHYLLIKQNVSPHTCPSNSISSIFLPASEPYIKQTSSYPRASVLRCQASAHCDYGQPLQQQHQLGDKTRHENDFNDTCVQVKMKVKYATIFNLHYTQVVNMLASDLHLVASILSSLSSLRSGVWKTALVWVLDLVPYGCWWGISFSGFNLFIWKKGKLVLGDDGSVGSGSESWLSPRDDFFKSNNCYWLTVCTGPPYNGWIM